MTVDMEKVRQKLQFMRKNLKDLEYFQDMSLEEFLGQYVNEAAATRMLQITIEAMIDLCAHIIAREGWGLPKSYGETIGIAVQNEIIPKDMEETYRNIVRFRNRVVHLYDEVNPEEIYEIINSRLEDFRPFMANIIKNYLTEA